MSFKAHEVGQELICAIRFLTQKGWSPATAGNFSALLSRDPFRILLSPSGVDKAALTAERLIVVDEQGAVVEGDGRPSAETLLHCVVYQNTSAQCVLHTHSVSNTALSRIWPHKNSLTLAGYEMLKALPGVLTHETTVEVPILQNSQDIPQLSLKVKDALRKTPPPPGFLLARHGLYAWGNDVSLAQRAVEALEFLFEVRVCEELLGAAHGNITHS